MLYISLNKSCLNILSELETENVDTRNVFIVDATGSESPKSKPKNCLFTDSGVRSLTELSIFITRAISSSECEFLFFDSLSTLTVFHSMEITEKFIHYLVSKLKQLDIGGVLFGIDDEKTDKIFPVMSQFCDATEILK